MSKNVLSTGKVAFPIEFDDGYKTFIYFRPNDREFWQRIEKFEKSIEEKANQIDMEKYKSTFDDGIDVNFDIDHPEKIFEMSKEELASLKNKVNAVNSIEEEHNKVIREELDVVFDSKISDVAFKYCQPFDIVCVPNEDGTEETMPYILHFMHWLFVELKKKGIQNDSAMNKYIAKYSK